MNDLKNTYEDIEIPEEQPVPTQEEFAYVQQFPQDDWELELTKLRARKQVKMLTKVHKLIEKKKRKEAQVLAKKHQRRERKR